jgi:hypothetical protein
LPHEEKLFESVYTNTAPPGIAEINLGNVGDTFPNEENSIGQ